MDRPETRYARAPDGTFLAYQVFGSGPIDLLVVLGFFSNVDENWRIDEIADTWERLGRFARVIVMDRRGVGLSDRLPPDMQAPLEEHVDDVLAVLDAAHCTDVCLLTTEAGAALSLLFAAAHPGRVRALALYAPLLASPLRLAGMDHEAWDREVFEEYTAWGDPFAQQDFDQMIPSYSGDVAKVRAWGAYLRAAASPGSALSVVRQWWDMDARGVLGAVRTPTLLLTRSATPTFERLWAASVSDILAALPGTTHVDLPGRDLPFWFGDRAGLVAELEEFFTGRRPPAPDERVLATVLFTDIVDSTRTASHLGDAPWKELLAEHDTMARAEVARANGRYVDSTGDGLLATFDGPARAVRCAAAITDGARGLGLRIRAGCHTGEVELAGESIRGLAVHIGARVAALAGAEEVLATSTVKDLTVGSGLRFHDAGVHDLKGVPQPWHLYRVVLDGS